jgi:hypothetical protein
MIKNMTSSNWVTIAWDENGVLCPGKIEAEGTIIDIHESFVYVHDEKAWKENSGFGRYTIMEISEGQLRYNRFKIVVARGINDGIFFAAEYNNSNTEDDKKKQIFGFSCCIYEDDSRVTIVEDAKIEFFYWLEESQEDWWYNIDIDYEKIADFVTFSQVDLISTKDIGTDVHICTDACMNTEEPSSRKELKNVKDEYPYGECPDCHEPIPDNIIDGDKCSNCGHIFHHIEAENVKRIEEMRDEGYMQRSQGWKKGMGL